MARARVPSLTVLVGLVAALAGCAASEGAGGVIDDPDEIDILSVPGQRNPVIIVHGCPPPPGTDAGDLSLTDDLRDYFLARGYPEEEVVKYLNPGPVCDSTLTQADHLAELVLALSSGRGQKVDLVAHSMGALTARLVAARYPNAIDDLITIAGANHGTAFGASAVAAQLAFGAPAYEGAKEMFPPYACEGETVQAADVQFALNGCLTLLGRSVWRDETPGSIDYLSIRNLLDEIIEPVTSSCLNQNRLGDCSDTTVNRSVVAAADLCPDGSPCPAHAAMLWDPTVMQMVYAFASAAE